MSAITDKINEAVNEFKKRTTQNPKAIRLGQTEARRLYAWAMDNDVIRWRIETQEVVLTKTPEEFLRLWEYQGLRVEPTTAAEGIEIY